MDLKSTVHASVLKRLKAYQDASLAIYAHPEVSNHEY